MHHIRQSKAWLKCLEKWNRIDMFLLAFFLLAFVLTYLMRMYAVKKILSTTPTSEVRTASQRHEGEVLLLLLAIF